jgi:hypothetical protein
VQELTLFIALYVPVGQAVMKDFSLLLKVQAGQVMQVAVRPVDGL